MAAIGALAPLLAADLGESGNRSGSIQTLAFKLAILDSRGNFPAFDTSGTGSCGESRVTGETILMRRIFPLAVVLGLALVCPAIAQAQIRAKITLSAQRMDVYVDGAPVYNWSVSTARPGYRTPVGTFKPTALVRYHRSTIYDGSPMPYSIFFLRGYAIHGSYEIKHLGRPASHGCIRLHPKNAATLYSLVQKHGPANTVIEIGN